MFHMFSKIQWYFYETVLEVGISLCCSPCVKWDQAGTSYSRVANGENLAGVFGLLYRHEIWLGCRILCHTLKCDVVPRWIPGKNMLIRLWCFNFTNVLQNSNANCCNTAWKNDLVSLNQLALIFTWKEKWRKISNSDKQKSFAVLLLPGVPKRATHICSKRTKN